MKNTCIHCHAENDLASKYCSTCGYALPVVQAETNNDAVKTEKKPKNKTNLNVKTVIGIVIGSVFGYYISQLIFNPSQSVDKKLTEMAEEMNKNCPMRLDEYTSLKNVVALPNKTVQYNYVLVGIKKAQVNLDTIKKYVFAGALQNAKTSPDMKNFRDNDVTMKYHYSDEDGVYVTQYVMTPEMYAK